MDLLTYFYTILVYFYCCSFVLFKMPARCCVLKGDGNYASSSEKVSIFEFPWDLERLSLWLEKIPRDDFQPPPRSVVCEQHFRDEFIVRIDSVTTDDGTVLSMKRERPKLTKEAYLS